MAFRALMWVFPAAFLLSACSSSDDGATAGGAGMSATGGAAGSAGAGGASAGAGGDASGGTSGGSGGMTPYVPPPASTVVETSPVAIRREVFLVKGVDAGENPTVPGSATPDAFASVRVVRYRLDTDPPTPARAIAVLMPGFLGGASSFDAMARALVRRSADGAAVEAWAVDRRSNLMEDQFGLDVAEVRKDPELAHAYYLDSQEVEGKSFQGFLAQSAVPWESEWGIATTVGDLHRVIGVIPQAERRGRVVLIGHSLGASIAEEYAAWDFDGTAGYAELSSLALVDGVSGAEGDPAPPRTQDQYEKGGDMAPGGFGTNPGLADIRKDQRYFALPLLGTKVYPVASIVAMRARWAPAGVVADSDRDKLLQTLLSVSPVPSMTNRAAMGFAFDAHSNGLSFAAISCGEGAGGALTEYDSLFGVKLIHPSDGAAMYTWLDYDQVTPKENTSLDEFSNTWFSGPALDFAEWYFPQRLTADVPVASTLVQAAGDYGFDVYGMRATHGKELDLPILAAPAGLLNGDLTLFDKLKKLAAPIGAGRPQAGKDRSDPTAFHAVPHPELTHIDTIGGTDVAGTPMGGWYDDLSGFVVSTTLPGGVVVPVQP